MQQLVSFQSPYLNSEGITGTNSLYNVRHGGKVQVKSSGNNSNMHTPLGNGPAEQFSQFRQANSYSVDRISRFQNVYSSATNSAIKQFQVSSGDSREKTDNNLSFESSKASNTNNSFTL